MGQENQVAEVEIDLEFLQKKLDSIPLKVNQANCIIAINVQFSGKIPESL